MRITIDTIPHQGQRYNTCGDYGIRPNGDWWITVSKMDDWRYTILVALHELVEVSWVVYNKINIGDIDSFDKNFEQEREEGKHSPEEEPGDDPKSPYHAGHVHATHMERLLSLLLGVNWNEYEKYIQNL